MSVSTRLRSRLDAVRPDTGSMGTLYQQRRSLYWLVVIVATLAYAGLVTFLCVVVGLVGLAGTRALLATISADYVATYAWVGLTAAGFSLLVGATWLAARWAAQYEVAE